MMKRILGCFALLAALVLSVGPQLQAQGSKDYILYVGTYTNGASKGIYAYRYNTETGEMKTLGLAAAAVNPSFLVADPDGKQMFAVNETETYQGKSSGGVTAFTIDRKIGKLSQLNEVASRGADPAYISLDRAGKYVLVANYTGGNVAVFPILHDGHLGEASSVIEDAGTLGPNKERQEKPHAHWIQVSAHNHFAYVADLGLDKVLIYKFDAATGKLSRGKPGASGKSFFSATLAPGSGPRHIAFSADGKFMYVISELDATVTVFANDGNQTYRSIQKISALPAGFSGENTAAEIEIHRSGKFLYTSNRGNDSIAEFSVDKVTGRLTLMGFVSTHGKEPRNFAIDPSGKHLLVANQYGDNIVEFDVDAATGRLKEAGEVAKVASPVCLVFVPAE
jgi:6-phosphogluconolactonase